MQELQVRPAIVLMAWQLCKSSARFGLRRTVSYPAFQSPLYALVTGRTGIIDRALSHQRPVFRKERLVIIPSACSLIQGVGKSGKNWWEGRLSQTGWVHIALHKMHINFLWGLTHTNHAIPVKVILIRHSVGKAQFSEKCIPNAIHNASFGKIGGRIRINYDAAV